MTPAERDPGGPPPAQRASILYDTWLLDIPKLMDIAVLYGAANRQLTSTLLRQVSGQLDSPCPSSFIRGWCEEPAGSTLLAYCGFVEGWTPP